MYFGRKGITGVLMTLILSGMVVALLFLGVFYSYEKLANDMGVKFSLDSLKQKPTFSYKGYIEFKNTTFLTNNTKCKEDCASNAACEAQCDKDYPDDSNYSVWRVWYLYHGFLKSRIMINLFEEQPNFGGGNIGIGKEIYSNMSEITLPGMEGYFDIKLKAYTPCESNITINLTAVDDPNVVPVGNKSHFDFCIGLPVKDVDVVVKSVLDTSDSSSNKYYISSNVSITGGDVPKLCPSADVYFFMLNETHGHLLPVLDCSLGSQITLGNIFYGVIDTNRSNTGWHWFDLDEFYRVGFNLTNDLPFDIDLSNGETADVVLDISESKLGYSLNLTPDDVINSTAIVSADIDQDGASPLDRNVTILETDNNGYVTKFKVEFVLNSSKLEDAIKNQCGVSDPNNFTSGCTLNFYAYLNTTSTQMYPQSDTSPYYPVYDVNLSSGTLYRTCYSKDNNAILGTDCVSCPEIVDRSQVIDDWGVGICKNK